MSHKAPFKKYAIRPNYATKHPHVLTENYGNKYKSVGITHAKATKGHKNVPLTKNPNPIDKRKSYLLSKPFIFKKNTYGQHSYILWRLTKEDKRKVDCISHKKTTGERKPPK